MGHQCDATDEFENKKTRQGLDFLHLVKSPDKGNILNNFVDITPAFDTSTTDVLQPLHPEAVENASPDPVFTNTETPMLIFYCFLFIIFIIT